MTNMVLTPSGPVQGRKIKTVTNKYFIVSFGLRGKCFATDDHLWPTEYGLKTTAEIYNQYDGQAKIPKYGYKIKVKKPKNPIMREFYCFSLQDKDKMFAIQLEQNIIEKIYDTIYKITHKDKKLLFVHNCQGRLACGRLGSIASMMFSGNTVATTINGAVPGEGMLCMNGVIYNVHYYFTEVDFLFDWYKKCGFSKKGYTTHGVYAEDKEMNKEEEKVEDVTQEELDDIFEFNPELVEFKIDDDLKKEINRSRSQEYNK